MPSVEPSISLRTTPITMSAVPSRSPEMMAGSASGAITWNMICRGLAPMAAAMTA